MKKLLIALTVFGTMHFSANAQAKHSKYDKNYKVCRKVNGKYYICGKKDSNHGMTVNNKKDEQEDQVYYHNSYSGYTGNNKKNTKLVPDPLAGPLAPAVSRVKEHPKKKATKVYNSNPPMIVERDYVSSPQQEAPVSPNTGMVSSNCVMPNEKGGTYGMQVVRSYTGYSHKHQSHIRVTYDHMDNPYKGEPSLQNDGVQQNKYRNINYQQQVARDLPPNDGSSLK